MKYVLTILFGLIFLNCSKDDVNIANPSVLKGKWIEVETRMDTLSFELLGDSEIVNLNRGKVAKDGNSLPKPGSGPYNYFFAGEKISLNWMLSSDSSFKEYGFKIIGNKLNIGNFYGSTSGETLTFVKLD